MESQWMTEYSHAGVVDKGPRKRARAAWDVPPLMPPFKAVYCGQKVVNGAGSNLTLAPSYGYGVHRDASPPWRDDDKNGHYIYAVGENLTSRYRILSKMGEGTFGQVLECWDQENKELVAIKIVRSIQKYREAAMIEIDILQKLAKHDIFGSRCVQIRNWFDYRNHICIVSILLMLAMIFFVAQSLSQRNLSMDSNGYQVFEKLGPSLYDFLRKNSFRSFPIDMVREFGRQLLESVAFMHELRLVHTDLKPENILLVSSDYVKVPDLKLWMKSTKDYTLFKNIPKSNAIKLIDFGSTTFGHQDHSYVVSTRHYRAPEVILGLGWNYPCDLWSVGCILMELCSGEALFQTHENLEHLAMMERVLGPMPHHIMNKAERSSEKYFRRGARLNWPEGANSRESLRAVLKLSRLHNLVMQHVDHSAGDFIDLLQGLLRYDPSERMKAREALWHPFFTRDPRSVYRS